MKKRILSMLLVIVMVLSLVPVSALAEGEPLKIVSSGATKNFVIDRDTEFSLTVKEGENTVDGVTWSAEPAGVLHPMVLPTGKLVGFAPGDVTVTATLPDGRTVSEQFSVYILPQNLTIVEDDGTVGGKALSTNLKLNDVVPVKYVCDNDIGTHVTSGWKLLDNADGVLSFNQKTRELTASKSGTAKLRLAVNGAEKIVTFTVKEDVAGHITPTPDAKTLSVGDTMKLTLSFTGSEPYPDDGAITWTCESSDIELTQNGKECTVLGKNPTSDEIEIVARWTGNCVAYKLKVVNAAPLSIAVDGTSATAIALTGSEEQKTLTVTGLPEGKTAADIEWGVVSGDDVLNVERKGTDLEVSGAKVGTAVVTAKVKGLDGTQASVTITVQPKATIANKPADGSKKTLYVGDTFTCKLEAELVDAKDLTLVPSEQDAVEINGSDITAKKAATGVKISLMKGETEFDSFLLDVLGQARIEIDPEMSRELLTGDKLDLKAVVKDASGAVLEGKTVSWKYIDSIDANMTVLGSSTLTANPNPTIPFDVELRAYLNDEELGELSADVTISVTPRTASVALMKGTENISNKTTILSVKETAGILVQAVIMPENARQVVSWDVTPRDICEFTPHDDSIEIKPVGAQKTGTVTVIATAADGTGARCETKVELVKTADTIQITNAPAQMRGGANIQLRTNLDDDKTLTDRRVVWSVPKELEQIASVTADGILDTAAVTKPTPIKVEVTLVANGEKGEANITLYPAVTNIKIVRKDKSKLENVLAYTSAPIELGMEVTPTEEYGSFVWTSSNEKIATVDPASGEVILHDAGNVRISCTAYDTDYETALKIARGEIRDDSKVMVTGYKSLEIVKKATDVVINEKSVTELVSGKNATFTATVYADLGTELKAGNQKVTWHVEDEYGNPTKAATINSRGRLYAKTVNYGTYVVVYATSVEDNEVFDCHTVLIQPKKERTFAAFLEDDDGIEGDGRIIESVLYMNAGETATISGKWYVRDEGFSYEEDCLFFSSNRSVATIDQYDGTLETLKKGSTTITVRATDPDTNNVYTTKFTLKVMNTVDHITISRAKNTPDYVRSGKSVDFYATVWSNVIETIKADNQGVTWGVYEEDGDDLVATKAAYMTSGGVLVAKSVTENTPVVVVATSKENPSVIAEFPMTIRPASVYTVSAGYVDDEGEYVIPTGAMNLEVMDDGDSVSDVCAWVYVSDPNSPAIDGDTLTDGSIFVWETSNKDIVKVVDGQLKYTGRTGKVKVTPTYKAGNVTYRGNTLTLNIIKSVESIEVTKKYANQELYSGKSLLMYAIVDEYATTRRVTWSLIGEGDNAVASINPTTGLIRAKKGLTKQETITVQAMATDGSGETGELDVTIYPLATRVAITSTFKTITVGDDGKQMTAKVFPFAEKDGVQIGANQDVKWSSSRSSVLAVDENGNLTAKRRGTATIKAKAVDGSGKYATIRITVTNS